MILNSALKRLEILLGEAMTTSNCDITASYGDQAVSGFLPGASDTASNGVTAVVVVAAPAAGVVRQAKEVRLHNNDTVPHNVVLRLNDNGTFRIVLTALVPSGGNFLYTPEAVSGIPESETLAGLSDVLINSPTDGQDLAWNASASRWENDSRVIGASAIAASAAAGKDAVLQSGAGDGAAAGGQVTVHGGAGGSTGDGGYISIAAGAAGTGATGGSIDVQGGASGTLTGYAYIQSANATGTGDSGEGGVGSGQTGSGTSGHVFVYSGDSSAGTSGEVSITSGAAFTQSGAVSVNSAASKATGNVSIYSDNATAGNSGNAFIATGNATGGGHTVGSIVVTVGTASAGATVGQLRFLNLPTSDPGIAGAVWIDTATHILHISP